MGLVRYIAYGLEKTDHMTSEELKSAVGEEMLTPEALDIDILESLMKEE